MTLVSDSNLTNIPRLSILLSSSRRRASFQGILIVFSCATTQNLVIISVDTEKRTDLLRSPWLWSFVRSSASTDGKAVRANDTNIAGWGDDVCLSTSFLSLVPLTDLSICTTWKVTEAGSAHWTGATIKTRRTFELAVYQGICCTSLPILGSWTERRAGACGEIAEFPSTHGAMAAIQTWRTTKLTIDNLSFCSGFLVASGEGSG